jgi:transcriptional regulator with XRE-family HTH domain
MTSRQAQIQEDTHFRIMRILQENPDLTQRELAERLGMSVGGLNLLTPMGIAEKVALTTRFLSRKMEEYEALKLEIEALRSEVNAAGQDKTQKA